MSVLCLVLGSNLQCFSACFCFFVFCRPGGAVPAREGLFRQRPQGYTRRDEHSAVPRVAAGQHHPISQLSHLQSSGASFLVSLQTRPLCYVLYRVSWFLSHLRCIVSVALSPHLAVSTFRPKMTSRTTITTSR